MIITQASSALVDRFLFLHFLLSNETQLRTISYNVFHALWAVPTKEFFIFFSGTSSHTINRDRDPISLSSNGISASGTIYYWATLLWLRRTHTVASILRSPMITSPSTWPLQGFCSFGEWSRSLLQNRWIQTSEWLHISRRSLSKGFWFHFQVSSVLSSLDTVRRISSRRFTLVSTFFSAAVNPSRVFKHTSTVS